MTSVSPYVPTWDFATDPNPQDEVNAQALQTQLNLVADNLDALTTALAVSIRDDDTLTDELVRLRNLHPELSAYIISVLSGAIATQNVVYVLPVTAATTANITLSSLATAIDGVTLFAGDRVLVKNQTNTVENGIWIASASAWTRATDLAAGAAITSNIGVVVQAGGTVNADTAWQLRPLPTTTDPDVYAASPIVGTNRLGWFTIYTLFPLPVAKGGTGGTTAATARAGISAAGFYTTTITGTGSATSFTITHNLGTRNVVIKLRDGSTYEDVGVTTVATTTNAASVTFSTAPALGATFLVTVIGASP